MPENDAGKQNEGDTAGVVAGEHSRIAKAPTHRGQFVLPIREAPIIVLSVFDRFDKGFVDQKFAPKRTVHISGPGCTAQHVDRGAVALARFLRMPELAKFATNIAERHDIVGLELPNLLQFAQEYVGLMHFWTA